MATDYDAYDAILHHIFRETQGDAWFKPLTENLAAGVCLRVTDPPLPTAKYRVFPYENLTLAPFEAAVRALNPVVAVKVRSAAIHAALASVSPTANALYVDDETRIQILDTMARLPRADKEQCAAFIRDERVLVVWSDALAAIIPTCHDFQRKLTHLVMRSLSGPLDYTAGAPDATPPDTSTSSPTDPTKPATEGSSFDPANVATAKGKEKENTPVPKTKKGRNCWGFGHVIPDKTSQLETGVPSVKRRPTRLLAPFYGGLGCGLSVFFVATGLQTLLGEWRLDGDWMRFFLCVTMPFIFCVSLFFTIQLVGNICFCIGPVSQYHENSKYYSAVRPEPNKVVDDKLPHITIQMPVYKESLEQTIQPSVESLKKAMQTYARQGGTSTIFINDDGMQLISPAERAARQAFYAQHGIGWVARPKHDPNGSGFIRPGRFKKASNMNYALALSLKVEKFVMQLLEKRTAAQAASGQTADSARSGVTSVTEADSDTDMDIEDRALQLALEETFEETERRWMPWAANGRAIRVGEIILIVDSDTIVPEDCFRDAARELAESPELAIIQHESDVMQVAHHYFENGIAHFTRRINKAISMACANGEVAPFVGHNAFLRWSAIQDAAFIDKADGLKKTWSESNVSEDFDMALRLQLSGYTIRWASYSNGGFKEGVSLTCDDELNRWEKYAYGCNELLFNPLIDWWRKGPINAQLHQFVWSDAPLHYKLSMLAYMFSYYGIAAGATLSLLNYVLLGFTFSIDGYYLRSWEVWLACMVVFPGAGNLGFAILEYRLGQKNLLVSLMENIKWIPFFFFFFGGLGIHLSTALLAHMFSCNMQWQATKKEVERSNFFIEGPRILKRFWLSFSLSFAVLFAMIFLSTDLVPPGWQIPGSNWAVVFPMALTVGCHILFPIVLNPWLMIFSY
ncbi:glycosyl transferase family group 2-domain-containing protein [Hysterangium stoloniferum]|nr:glycosyl transferase family group 2-domain-containing protein [Hysterangium stoloniferum]